MNQARYPEYKEESPDSAMCHDSSFCVLLGMRRQNMITRMYFVLSCTRSYTKTSDSYSEEIMKFKNSVFEIRFNDFWNNKVVKTDLKIRSALNKLGLFDSSDALVVEKIKEYHINIKSFINSLQKQVLNNKYSDPKYAHKYLLTTIATVRSDLESYAKKNPNLLGLSLDFMDYLDSKERISYKNIGKKEIRTISMNS